MNQPAVTHAAVLQPHRRRTPERLRPHDGVVPQTPDGTELDCTGHPALHDQRGQIGPGHGRGSIGHNSPAAAAGRMVCGLVNPILHHRGDVPAHATAVQKRQREARESLPWRRGVADVGAAPAGRLWVDAGDGLGDTFAVYDHEAQRGRP